MCLACEPVQVVGRGTRERFTESPLDLVSANNNGTIERYIIKPRAQLSLCQRFPRANQSLAGIVDSGLCLNKTSSGTKLRNNPHQYVHHETQRD